MKTVNGMTEAEIRTELAKIPSHRAWLDALAEEPSSEDLETQQNNFTGIQQSKRGLAVREQELRAMLAVFEH